MILEWNKASDNQQLAMIVMGIDKAMYRASKDKEAYITYKMRTSGESQEEQNVEMEVLTLLDDLGYPMDELGTYLYKNMIVKVVQKLEIVEKTSDILSCKFLITQLKEPFSQFYVDIARCDLDIGVKTFHKHVEAAIEKVDFSKANPTLLFEIYSNFSEGMDYGEQAFILGSYFSGALKARRPEAPVVKKLTGMSNIELKAII